MKKILKVVARINILFFIISYSCVLTLSSVAVHESHKRLILTCHKQRPTKTIFGQKFFLDKDNDILAVSPDGYLVALKHYELQEALRRKYSAATEAEIYKYCKSAQQEKEQEYDQTIGAAIFGGLIGYPLVYMLLISVTVWLFSGKFTYGKWYLQ